MSELDPLFDSARATWQSAIRRDDEGLRVASERRLVRAVESWSHRRRSACGTILVASVAVTTLLGIAIGRGGSAPSPAEIRADAPPIAASVVSAEAVPSTPTPAAAPSSSASAGTPARTPPRNGAPSSIASTAQPSALPPLPPPEERASRASARLERQELRIAARDLEGGEIARARESLRSLARRHAGAVSLEAALMLARSYGDPRDELAVWDDAMVYFDGTAERVLAQRERARLLRRLRPGVDAGVTRDRPAE